MSIKARVYELASGEFKDSPEVLDTLNHCARFDIHVTSFVIHVIWQLADKALNADDSVARLSFLEAIHKVISIYYGLSISRDLV